MDNDIEWMNRTMAQATWPDHSANLHDRILARTHEGQVLVFFRRPGLKLSALALAAMVAGFCFGTLGWNNYLPQSEQSYANTGYYTGSGLMLSEIMGS